MRWGLHKNYIYLLESRKKPFSARLEPRVIELEAEVRHGATHVSLVRSAELRGEFKDETPTPYGSPQERVKPAKGSTPKGWRKVPIISHARAGAGLDYADLEAQIDEAITVETGDANAYALLVEGDSMIPVLQHGDVVVASPNSYAVNHQIVVAKTSDDGVMVKRFRRTGASGEIILLESYNPEFEPIKVAEGHLKFAHPVIEMRRRNPK